MKFVVSMGEALIDFVSLQPGRGLADTQSFVRSAGGAPANVSAAVSRLGLRKASFLGMVGDDAFGRHIRAILEGNGVDTNGLISAKGKRTTLAFVSLTQDGDPEFVFYPGADFDLQLNGVQKKILKSASVFHYGTISLLGRKSAKSLLLASEIARNSGALLSFDPNIRLNLWNGDIEAVRTAVRDTAPKSHIIKVSVDELMMLTKKSNINDCVDVIRQWHPTCCLMAVTRGPKGCTIINQREIVEMNGYKVNVEDTTGAGDAFIGCLLSYLAKKAKTPEEVANLTKAQLERLARLANASGALACTKSGAIPAMPDRTAVEMLAEVK